VNVENNEMTARSPARPVEAPPASKPAPDVDMQFVVCVVADERYGIEVGRVHEIIRLTAITALPGSDRSFSGVINLRGRIIPVMDVRLRFGLPDAAPTRHSRIVVAEAGGAQIGLVVDAVDEVVHIPASAIEPTPGLSDGGATEHLTGIARLTDGLVIMLDLERLLSSTIDGAGATAPGASA
jgi:purine-binding chemotaxis protein CheW